MPALKGSPVRCENGEVCSRRLRILTGVPPPPEDRYFKSGVFQQLGVILTAFVSAVFHETREIDLFARITRHKRKKTLILAPDFVLFTSAGLNRANRPLTDRESRLRSGYRSRCSADRIDGSRGYATSTNDRLTRHWLLRNFFREGMVWKLSGDFSHAEKKEIALPEIFFASRKNNFFYDAPPPRSARSRSAASSGPRWAATCTHSRIPVSE